MTTITAICNFCEQAFERDRYFINRSTHCYCIHKCASAARSGSGARGGITCRVCGKQSTEATRTNRLCKKCRKATAPCPCCGTEMPTYSTGGKRIYRRACSRSCLLRLVLAKETPQERQRKARKRPKRQVSITALTCSQ